MIIRNEFSGYWNGEPVNDTVERFPKVGDAVIVHPAFKCDNLVDGTVYHISSVKHNRISLNYWVTLNGHHDEYPADALCLVTRVVLDGGAEPTAYVVPIAKSPCDDLNIGDIVQTKSGYHLRDLKDAFTYEVTDKVGKFVKLRGKHGVYPKWGLKMIDSNANRKIRNDAADAIANDWILMLNSTYGIQKPTLLKPVPKTNSLIASIETSERDDYSMKEKIPVRKVTTTVTLQDGTKGSATCDAGEYDERTGVLNAIANAKCGGNFDSEYTKFCKNREKIARLKSKCGCCGKQYSTQEEVKECRKNHIENKIRKHENYLIRREAKRRLAEEEKEKAIKTAMEKIRKEEK